jgi:5-methylcytosine-specific restriction endonuclease McrA
MPIRPERKALYPENWPAISRLVILQAEDRCQECRVVNRAVGYRHPKPGGDFRAVPAIDRPEALRVLRDLRGPAARLTRIVLTVHHRDGDPTNNARENLVALCQRCHLRADRVLRQAAEVGSCPEFEPGHLVEASVTVQELLARGERECFLAGFRRGLAEGKPGEAAAVEDFRPAIRGACGEDLEDGEGAAI